MKIHRFALCLNESKENKQLLELLTAADCTDCFLTTWKGIIYGVFDREGVSKQELINEAIHSLEKVGLHPTVFEE